jgi:feruloyl esterase
LALTGAAFWLAGAAAAEPYRECERLHSIEYPALKILSATMVPAGTFATGDGQRFKVPVSCHVVALATPIKDSRIGFELWLPDGWKGRYKQLGNGGFAGNIDQASLANEIRRGNAAAMTDTGHKAGQFDASWALGHPERIVDYGYRSIKVTADAAKLLIGHYYGRPARRRYFIGCSNGGRQALMAAQRYPGDWDGVLAGSPAIFWTKQLATFAAIQHRLRASPQNWIPARKLPEIQRAAIAACPNAQTGARDCRLNVGRLLCRRGDGPNCLTPAQAASLELIQSGPRDGRGRRLFHGFAPTAALANNWDQWILNPDPEAPSELAFATQAFRYLIHDRPHWQIADFDHEQDFARASERMVAGRSLSDILDADDPDLRLFEHHGGKLILYVGGADAVISPRAGVDYYRSIMRQMGISTTRHFARLFVVPGMQHCQGGLAPNAFGQAWIAPALKSDSDHDVRLALEAWVERGREPRFLTATKYVDDGRTNRPIATQRLLPFPSPASAISNRPDEKAGRRL